jgi:hypothetical protein
MAIAEGTLGKGAIVHRAQARRRRSWPLPGCATILGRRLAGTVCSCSALVARKMGEKHMLQTHISNVSDILEVYFKRFIRMLQK